VFINALDAQRMAFNEQSQTFQQSIDLEINCDRPLAQIRLANLIDSLSSSSNCGIRSIERATQQKTKEPYSLAGLPWVVQDFFR
jgi:hypothetical protein